MLATQKILPHRRLSLTDTHARHTEDSPSHKTLPNRYPCSPVATQKILPHRRLSLTDAHARLTEDSPSQKTLPNRYPCSPHRRFSLTEDSP